MSTTGTPTSLLLDLGLTGPAGTDDAVTTTAPGTPTPQSPMSEESTSITAGLGGFLVVFALALALWVLGRDLTRRLRRMNRAEQERAAGPGEQGAGSGAPSSPAHGEVPDGPARRDPLG